MSTFAALLASVGKDGQSANVPPPKSPAPAAKPRPTAVANPTKPVASSGTPNLKRKAEDGDTGARPKTVRTESNSAISQTAKTPATSTTKPTPGANAGYKGTARPATAAADSIRPRPAQNAPVRTGAGSTGATATTPASAPVSKKGGFAATMARAAAAQEASKATGGHNIVHKPVEKLSRRERERRQAQEAAEKQKQKVPPGKGKVAQQAGRSRSGTPGDGKAGPQAKKAPVQVGYSGTMRKPVEVAYQGTMRAKDPAKPAQPAKQKDKFGGQDRYGGYASWSDLSEAEDEEDDGYGSESDDMEGGFDELEQEEAATARLARKEDLEEKAQEDRLKREKLERKKRLEAMAKQAGKKRF